MTRRLQRITVALAMAVFAVLPSARVALADEVRVAVATNFMTTMEALVEAFELQSEHTVLLSAGSTGSHYAQIKNGAPFEAFFSADATRPQLLEQEGIGIAGSRFVYAFGRLALWSRRAGYVDGDGRVLERAAYRHLAIANPALAPYGAAAREVLQRRGLWDAVQTRLVRGQDVGQTYGFIATQNAELGFVAYAQIKTPAGEPEGSFWLVPDSLHAPIEQHAILLRDVSGARAFLAFTKSTEARAIIRSFGYGP